jgi:hypothetical protein
VQSYRNKNYKEVWRYGGAAMAFKPSEPNNKWDGVARRVIRGDFGNGAARIASLSAAGYSDADINEIQQTVNYILKGG